MEDQFSQNLEFTFAQMFIKLATKCVQISYQLAQIWYRFDVDLTKSSPNFH